MAIERILLHHDTAIFVPKAHIITVKKSPMLITVLQQTVVDLIILEDLQSLKWIKESYPKIPVVIVTACGSIQQAVEAIRLGALDYISQVLTPQLIETIIEQVSEQLVQTVPLLAFSHQDSPLLLAESPNMQRVIADILKVAQSHAAVFISGESGTGKEVVAHTIHYQSSRQSHPFVKVNCAAIPESLIESEFFGHEKGSFTGAIDRRMGRFELANKGTLLLDEISEIPLHVQAKLLRVIQEKEFERVGGNKSIKVDVRLIATSNRNMKSMIEQKLFREDLYFRLNVVPIHLPPLREREEDILILSNYFLKKFCQDNRKKLKSFSPKAEQTLIEYPWPGNIRELSNTIERAVVMGSSNLIESQDLRLDPNSPALLSVPVTKLVTLNEIEKNHILETLSFCQHNRSQAAQILGISIRTLRNKLKTFLSK